MRNRSSRLHTSQPETAFAFATAIAAADGVSKSPTVFDPDLVPSSVTVAWYVTPARRRQTSGSAAAIIPASKRSPTSNRRPLSRHCRARTLRDTAVHTDRVCFDLGVDVQQSLTFRISIEREGSELDRCTTVL
jgi:hypothetical protein